MEDNVIKSPFDKGYVSKKVVEKEESVVEKTEETKPATPKKTTSKKTTSAAKKTTKPAEKKEPKKEEPSQVAVFSEGKLSHPAYGRLAKGYNVVSAADAKEWLAISNKVRMATPEEVANAFGE